VTVEGIDYAWAHPSPAALAAAGKLFACRYLSHDPAKNLTAAEAQQLHAAGIATVSNWEASAGAARNGYAQGVADAKAAAEQHEAAGGPADRPIYFSVDFDVPDFATGSDEPAAKLGPVAGYFRGVASVIGVARTGAYGGFWAISRLFDAGLIRWGWQTFAWSGGRWDARAQIQQYSNGVTVGGADSDLDRATVADYGQWGVGMTDINTPIPGTETPDHKIPRTEGEIEHDEAVDRAIRWGQRPVTDMPAGSPGRKLLELPDVLAAAAARDEQRDGAALAAITALTALIQQGGGSVAAAPIIAAVRAVGDDTHAVVVALQQQLADAHAEIRTLRAELEATLSPAERAAVQAG
jgi:hypothetical protein